MHSKNGLGLASLSKVSLLEWRQDLLFNLLEVTQSPSTAKIPSEFLRSVTDNQAVLRKFSAYATCI